MSSTLITTTTPLNTNSTTNETLLNSTDSTKTNDNNSKILSTCTRTLSLVHPIYSSVRDYVFELCDKGIGAIESNELIRKKFGEHTPTLCTIYKWRREYRGGKGERQYSGDTPPPNTTNSIEDSMIQQPKVKMIKKELLEKYCAACNREMSTRHYYEFHMLNVHDVLLGGSKSTMELLQKMSSTRKQQLTFRCDSCFNGKLDYDNFEQLQQHKSNEHGYRLKIPEIHFTKKNKTNNNVSSPPGKKRAHPKIARALTIGRDQSLPLPPPVQLRRSARIPKPTSAIIHSLYLTKDDQDFDIKEHKQNRTPQRRNRFKDEEDCEEDNALDDCIKGLKRRWSTKSKNLLQRFEKTNNNNIENSASTNEAKLGQEEEPFVTLLNDGRIEVEEIETKKPRNNKRRMLSPVALESADSMLMALASAALMEKANNNNSSTQFSSSSNQACSTSTKNLILNSSNSSIKSTTNKTTNKGIVREKKSIISSKTEKKQKKSVGLNEETNNKQTNNNAEQHNVLENNVQVNEGNQQTIANIVENNTVAHDTPTIENNVNTNNPSIIIPTSSPLFALTNGQSQAAMFISQDDSTWFGHSIAAQLRLMPMHIKELAKMRIQQVIFECNSSTFAPFHQFPQIQQKLVKQPQTSSSSVGVTISAEQNGNGQVLDVNDGERIIEETIEEVDVVTVEEQQKQSQETN